MFPYGCVSDISEIKELLINKEATWSQMQDAMEK